MLSWYNWKTDVHYFASEFKVFPLDRQQQNHWNTLFEAWLAFCSTGFSVENSIGFHYAHEFFFFQFELLNEWIDFCEWLASQGGAVLKRYSNVSNAATKRWSVNQASHWNEFVSNWHCQLNKTLNLNSWGGFFLLDESTWTHRNFIESFSFFTLQ